MIERILPDPVVAVEAYEDPPVVYLFPEEEAVIARAVDKRRREFGTVRACARSALATLGRPAVPILPDRRGAPGWPDGVVGSMTHCAGYRAAALARAGEISALGIDAEPHGPLPAGVLSAIAGAAELDWCERYGRSYPRVHWDRLLFCAKESVYKAWYPLTRRWLDFAGAEVTVDPEAGTFTARLLVPGPVEAFGGRWLVAGDLVVTAIAVPALS